MERAWNTAKEKKWIINSIMVMANDRDD